MMEDKMIFLLGGHDLEMLTILDILKSRGIAYKDKMLQWDNALLSQYKQELDLHAGDSSWMIYGIELQEDMVAPDNYMRIDHHNDYAKKESSLQQVAAILNYPLNRYQQLVAANDSGYIPEMYRAGATEQETIQIRLADRKAQGITFEEEMQAEKAIDEGMRSLDDGLIIVKACSSRFSPICDRLFPYKQLLIHTDHECVFYGKGASKLAAIYRTEISNRRCFYGGGEQGYFGTAADAFSPEELTRIIHHIISIHNDL